MRVRFLALIVLFVLSVSSFAGNIPTKAKSRERNRPSVSNHRPQIIQLAASLNGVYFIWDSGEINFLNSNSEIIDFVGSSQERATHFCSCRFSDSAYYISGAHIYFIKRIDGRFEISPGIETNGKVRSLVCGINDEAFFSVKKSIYKVTQGQDKSIYYHHPSKISQIGQSGSNRVYLYADRHVFLVENSSSAKQIICGRHERIKNLMALPNGDIAFSAKQSFGCDGVFAWQKTGEPPSYRCLDVESLCEIRALSANRNSLTDGSKDIFVLLGRSGVCHLEFRQYWTPLRGLPENQTIRSLAVDSPNRFYLSTDDGLFRWDRSEKTVGYVTLIVDRPQQDLLQRLLPLWNNPAYLLPTDILFGNIGIYLWAMFRVALPQLGAKASSLVAPVL